MSSLISQIVDVLRSGGIILYPTDTIWGIGCDACNAEAVGKVYALKRRDPSKSMIVLLDTLPNTLHSSPSTLHSSPFTLPPPLSTSHSSSSSRPTTYILPVPDNRLRTTDGRAWRLADNLPADDGTQGVRVPQHAFCQQLLQAFGGPIVSTSANFSGEPSPQCYEEISEKLKGAIDFCVPPLEEFLSIETRASRIIKVLPNGEKQVIRD